MLRHEDGPPVPAASALAAAQTRFAFRLLVALAGEKMDRNLLISPAGLAFALAILYGGAAGATQAALRTVLELPVWSVDEMHSAAQALQRALRQSGPDLELSMASGLWVARGLRLVPEYLQTSRSGLRGHGAELRLLLPGGPTGGECLGQSDDPREDQRTARPHGLNRQDGLHPH